MIKIKKNTYEFTDNEIYQLHTCLDLFLANYENEEFFSEKWKQDVRDMIEEFVKQWIENINNEVYK